MGKRKMIETIAMMTERMERELEKMKRKRRMHFEEACPLQGLYGNFQHGLLWAL
jgi:ribosome-associated translation inhibitor RaiA